MSHTARSGTVRWKKNPGLPKGSGKAIPSGAGLGEGEPYTGVQAPALAGRKSSTSRAARETEERTSETRSRAKRRGKRKKRQRECGREQGVGADGIAVGMLEVIGCKKGSVVYRL